jgi:hypothetical protein
MDANGKIWVVQDLPTTPTTYNVTCTNANTTYSQALPAVCRGYLIKAKTVADVIYGFADPAAAAYITIPGGAADSKDRIRVASGTLYFQSPTAGTVVQIQAWA